MAAQVALLGMEEMKPEEVLPYPADLDLLPASVTAAIARRINGEDPMPGEVVQHTTASVSGGVASLSGLVEDEGERHLFRLVLCDLQQVFRRLP